MKQIQLQFNICTFQNGESDCWPMECRPTVCRHPVLIPGKCCPTCEYQFYHSGEECFGGAEFGESHYPSANMSCLYSGQMYQNGDSWPIVEDSRGGISAQAGHRGGCASCKCKVGHGSFA